MSNKILVCEECSKTFTPSHGHFKNRRFCNRQCSNKAMRLIRDPHEQFFREKITRLKNNAKKREIGMSLTWQELKAVYEEQKGKCFYTGRPLQLSYSTKSRKVCPPDQLSVDRVDSSKGYELSNIVLCCYAINNFKGDLSLSEFREYLKFLNNKPLKVRFKKLAPDAVIPSYARPGDGAMDITATSKDWDAAKEKIVMGTGLAVEIPEGYVGLIFPRSSIVKTQLMLANSVGVIDSGYRGEIKFFFDPGNRPMKNYEVGDRIGQLVIMPYPSIEPVESDELSQTERGEGGFGSSGK